LSPPSRYSARWFALPLRRAVKLCVGARKSDRPSGPSSPVGPDPRVLTPRKPRLDEALAAAGFFESIPQACRAVMAGEVLVNGVPASKPGTPVRTDDVLSLAKRERFVGRGGYKLEAALEFFGIELAGRNCLDVGASTGGFTDCLLQRGANRVVAVDVGRGQLDWRLRNDQRVDSREGVNARMLEPIDFQPPPTLAVGDVSFISLTLILPAVFRVLESGSDVVFLIKPQFEAPREAVERGGIVRNEAARLECIQKIQKFVEQSGHQWRGHIVSPITGRDGNVEYLFHACRA
jgi:23S rRNA (cytidine1920-2'-O)/16S rRNA (cytidine1409-2'-O)-methyltransferase